MAERNITPELIRALFAYNKDSGVLTNKVTRSPKAKIGAIAGGKKINGYVSIKIFGYPYMAHRLIWAHVHGAFPTKYIDHINGDRCDNRLSNLREASPSENAQNAKLNASNKSGFTGVRKHGERWRAGIKLNGVNTDLGIHETPESAYAAYLFAKSKSHKFNPLPRR